jgi:error-prone DNA polymerase
MGFYSPSTLVQDARRHGVEVRPVDVAASDWECTLERSDAHAVSLPPPAVRLGLLMVKGLSQAAGVRIAAARSIRPFDDVADLARRAALNRSDLSRLAAAGALAPLAGHRRNAHWLAAGMERSTELFDSTAIQEDLPGLEPPRESDDLLADYQSLGLTLGRHPLALLRSRLARMRMSTASELHALPDGKRARTVGIVTCRQRPGTAQGVVFVTLEDETGHVNVVVWRDLVERQRRELLGSRLLGVEGVLQKEGDVAHLVAHRLVDHSRLLGRLTLESRDFH